MRRVLWIGLLAALVSGCGQDAFEGNWAEKFVPASELEFSKQYLALFPARDFIAIEELLDPRLQNESLQSDLEAIVDFIPAVAPLDIKVVGAQVFKVNSIKNAAVSSYNVEYQYEYPDMWLFARVRFSVSDGERTVTHFNFQLLPDSLEATNKFTLANKGLAHYGIIAVAVFLPLFIILVLVVCIRTPMPRRKWLWLIFILLGVCQVHFNWTSGEFGVQPLRVQLLASGYSKSGPVSPWYIMVAFPLGAVMFLMRRKRWLEAQRQSSLADVVSDEVVKDLQQQDPRD